MGTEEYSTGSAGLAKQLRCSDAIYGNGVRYRLPTENGDSWLIDMCPKPGLAFTDAYVTLTEKITRKYEMTEPGIWIWSLASGEVSIVEQGKKPWQLAPGINVLINRGKPFEIIYGASQPLWWTSMLLSADCREQYFQVHSEEQSIVLSCLKGGKTSMYNTPDMVMAFEQVKYAIRSAFDTALPLFYYECKMGEILAFILRISQNETYWKTYLERSRNQSHMTYQNRKYIWRVKNVLDEDILRPPTLEQLTVVAGMGESRLRRYFRQWYGITIADYIRQGKLQYALRLLSHDEMSISNIAAVVGYESASKFSAAFKKVYQVTPSEVRKSFQI